MGFGAAVQSAFKKAFVYQGRASRSEYWWFYLFYVVTFAVLITVCIIIASITNDQNVSGGTNPIAGGLFILAFLYLFALMIVDLSLAVRRLHDSGKSGLFMLLVFVPFGGFVLLVFFCMSGTSGANQYGEDPLRPITSVF